MSKLKTYKLTTTQLVWLVIILLLCKLAIIVLIMAIWWGIKTIIRKTKRIGARQ